MKIYKLIRKYLHVISNYLCT